MKKIQCENCGGKLEIDEKKEFASCPFCGIKYKLNEDVNVHVKYENGSVEPSFKELDPVHKVIFVVAFLIILFIFGVVIYFNVSNFSSSTSNHSIGTDSKVDNLPVDYGSGFFNAKFMDGEIHVVLVKNDLEDVIKSNQTSGRIIEVSYNGVTTSDKDEIRNIENSLDKQVYNVVFDYDSEGYINKITLN